MTLNSGALVSPMVEVASGDSINCNMTRTGDNDWFIGSQVASTGKTTNQNANAKRLAVQPWVGVTSFVE